MTLRDDILERARSVPALPTGTHELVGLLQDPDSDSRRICELITYDPQLAAYVLKVANSAASGAQVDVLTIGEAWVRLGAQKILSTLLASHVAPLANQRVDGYDLREGCLWEGAVGVALATEELARMQGKVPSSEAFSAGLLADFGKYVLGDFVADRMDAIGDLAFEQGLSFDQAEREALGIDHAEVGAVVLEAWGLPRQIVDVVRWHHDPAQCPEDNREAAELVHLGTVICNLAGLGGGQDGTHYLPSEEAIARSGITSTKAEHVLYHVIGRMQEVRELFALPSKT